MTWTLPPLQHQLLANAFDLLLLQPSRSLQPCPRSLLVPAPRAPSVSRAPSQPRAAVTESENSACDFIPAPRSADGILDLSMDSVFLAAFRVDTDFNSDSSTDTVSSTAVQEGDAAQTALRPSPVSTRYTLQNEGTKIGEPPASHTPTRPDSIDHTRQPTARIARRIARHAAIAAGQASPDLAAAVGTSADLTSAVHAPADLTSAVHAPAELTSAVRDPAALTSAAHAPAVLTSSVQAPAVPTTVCRPLGVLPPSEARIAPAPSFSPYQTRPATPLRPTVRLRSAYAFASCPLACRPPSYVERSFLEPEPLARSRAGVWLDARWPQVGPGPCGLLPDESGPFLRQP